MTSSDDTPGRVSTDLLATLVGETNVADLAFWEGSPWQHDVGAATVRDGVFGKLRLPIVHEGVVIYGEQIVEAERIEPKDDGRLMVIDLTPLGWSAEKATAAVLGEMTADRAATVDDETFADLLLSVQAADAGLAEAAGWGEAGIDALLASIEADSGVDDVDDVDGVGGVGDSPTASTLIQCPACQQEFTP